MNTEQKTRLEIMQALEKDFPDRVLEDLIDVARYVEHGGVNFAHGAPEAPEPPELPSVPSGPRTWASLADIPDNVGWAEDKDGDLIKRITLGMLTMWLYKVPDYADLPPTDEDGPFTEVLS